MKSKLKIISIVGARPQFIKLAPLIHPLSTIFNHLIVHTGQHYDDDMSSIFFRQLNIPRVHVNLNVSGGSHGDMIGRMLIRIEQVLVDEKPDFVLVYGDANSTLAGALAASKLSIPVGHIEAGMRTNGNDMPEEINRRMTDHVSEILFCPTETAVGNLQKERIKKRIVLSGDMMLELLHSFKRKTVGNESVLKKYGVRKKQYNLLTVHRPANTDNRDNLKQIVEIADAVNCPILFPVHPRTRKRLQQFKLLKKLQNLPHLILTSPLNYFDTLTLARYARVVLTDSGGLQKEALFMRTPVLILRNETEWVETIRMGNHLVGLDKDKIISLLGQNLTTKPLSYLVRQKKPSHIVVKEVIGFLKNYRT